MPCCTSAFLQAKHSVRTRLAAEIKVEEPWQQAARINDSSDSMHNDSQQRKRVKSGCVHFARTSAHSTGSTGRSLVISTQSPLLAVRMPASSNDSCENRKRESQDDFRSGDLCGVEPGDRRQSHRIHRSQRERAVRDNHSSFAAERARANSSRRSDGNRSERRQRKKQVSKVGKWEEQTTG